LTRRRRKGPCAGCGKRSERTLLHRVRTEAVGWSLLCSDCHRVGFDAEVFALVFGPMDAEVTP
jgi:hypothetical protein